jgi:hypothetical protein
MKFPVLRLNVKDFITFYQKQNPGDNPKFKRLVFQFHIEKHGLHHNVLLIAYAMGDDGDVMHKEPIELVRAKGNHRRDIDAPFNLGNLELGIKSLINLIGVFNKPPLAETIRFDPVRLTNIVDRPKTSQAPKSVGAETSELEVVSSDQDYVGYTVSSNKEDAQEETLNPCPPRHCRDKGLEE